MEDKAYYFSEILLAKKVYPQSIEQTNNLYT